MKKVDKPWGHELIWAHTEKYVGKILFLHSEGRGNPVPSKRYSQY